jgi:16S rRNA (guanine527-N7)-methyltransferase
VAANIISQYFSNLTPLQQEQFSKLKELYTYWNERINVISRKDMDNFYEHHVLHSLAIAKVVEFKDDANVLDVGTGGGFPGIPLAILFPNVKFHLVDSIGKKILVVNEVAQSLGLKNVTSQHERAEKINHQYDFIVSRAVTAMPEFLRWVRGKLKKENIHELPNGILYLKGGDLSEELKGIKHHIKIYNLSDYFQEEFFETKKVVYVR